MADEELNFESILYYLKAEKEISSLVKLPSDFFIRALEYEKKLKAEYENETRIDPIGTKALLAGDNYRKIHDAIRKIYELRERKLLFLALHAVHTDEADVPSLTPADSTLFNRVLDELRKARARLFGEEESIAAPETPAAVQTEDFITANGSKQTLPAPSEIGILAPTEVKPQTDSIIEEKEEKEMQSPELSLGDKPIKEEIHNIPPSENEEKSKKISESVRETEIKNGAREKGDTIHTPDTEGSRGSPAAENDSTRRESNVLQHEANAAMYSKKTSESTSEPQSALSTSVLPTLSTAQKTDTSVKSDTTEFKSVEAAETIEKKVSRQVESLESKSPMERTAGEKGLEGSIVTREIVGDKGKGRIFVAMSDTSSFVLPVSQKLVAMSFRKGDMFTVPPQVAEVLLKRGVARRMREL